MGASKLQQAGGGRSGVHGFGKVVPFREQANLPGTLLKARRAKSKHARLAGGREREISGLGRWARIGLLLIILILPNLIRCLVPYCQGWLLLRRFLRLARVTLGIMCRIVPTSYMITTMDALGLTFSEVVISMARPKRRNLMLDELNRYMR